MNQKTKGRTIKMWPQDKLPAHNTSGIRGLRLKAAGNTIHVCVTGHSDGKRWGSAFSVETHGPVGATKLAMALRTKRMGVKFGLKPEAAWAKLRKAAGL